MPKTKERTKSYRTYSNLIGEIAWHKFGTLISPTIIDYLYKDVCNIFELIEEDNKKYVDEDDKSYEICLVMCRNVIEGCIVLGFSFDKDINRKMEERIKKGRHIDWHFIEENLDGLISKNEPLMRDIKEIKNKGDISAHTMIRMVVNQNFYIKGRNVKHLIIITGKALVEILNRIHNKYGTQKGW